MVLVIVADLISYFHILTKYRKKQVHATERIEKLYYTN